MPDIFTDPEAIEALYNDPENVALLVEMAMQTGAVVAGLQNLANTNTVQETQGTGGVIYNQCFVRETNAQLWTGEAETFGYLYKNRSDYIGQMAKSFDADNNIVPGEIYAIFKSKAYELLEVKFEFEREPMLMVKTHRFWTPDKKFVPMCLLPEGADVSNHQNGWGTSRIESKKIIPVKKGIDVFNMTIKKYHAYFAFAGSGDPKAVSNSKLPDIIT